MQHDRNTQRVINMETAARDIAVKWFLTGRKEPDSLFRFAAYWEAFSQLYSFGRETGESRSETDLITSYCKDSMALLEQMIDFSAPYMAELKKQPVATGTEDFSGVDWTQGNMNRIVIKMAEAAGDDPDVSLSQDDLRQIAGDYINVSRDAIPLQYRIISLFTTFYRLRVNLGRGKANADPGRDCDVITGAADVLGLCLPVLLTNTFHLNE